MAALLLSLTAANAQKSADEFSGYWFIQLQGGVGLTVGETSFGDLISPTAAFNFGYRFTPVWGLRAGLSGWQGKGYLINAESGYKYNWLQGNVDVVADICGMFSYRRSRALTPYLYAGIGVNGAFNNDEANALANRFPADNLLWDGSSISPTGRFGIGTGIRLADAVHLNIEVGANVLNDKFNSKKASAADWQITAQAGLTFNIGMKKAKKAVEEEYIPEPEPAPAPAPEPEPEPEPAPVPVVVEPEPAPAPFEAVTENVFFTIGKYELRKSETAKLDEVATILKENEGTRVDITGYADATTGTKKRNQYLSEKRANAVADYLISKGVAKDRITVDFKGDSVQPFQKPEENRVAICIVK